MPPVYSSSDIQLIAIYIGEFPLLIDGSSHTSGFASIVDYLRTQHQLSLGTDLSSSQRADLIAYANLLPPIPYIRSTQLIHPTTVSKPTSRTTPCPSST